MAQEKPQTDGFISKRYVTFISKYWALIIPMNWSTQIICDKFWEIIDNATVFRLSPLLANIIQHAICRSQNIYG